MSLTNSTRSDRQVEDDHHEQSSLEQRINQLKASVENMQKKMDRFIQIKKRELSKQAEIYAQEKRQWEQERTQLQTELQHYKTLLQKTSTYNSSTQTFSIELQSSWARYANHKPLMPYSSKDYQNESLVHNFPTANSSSQTFSTEFVNNAIRLQKDCIKPYNCPERGQSYPEYSCDEEFFKLDDFKKHFQIWHSLEADNTTKDSLTESRAAEKFVDNKKFIVPEGSIELHCEPTMTKEEETPENEQTVQQSVEVDPWKETLQDTLHISKNQDEKPEDNLSLSLSELLTPSSLMQVYEETGTDMSLSLTEPSVNLIDDQARKKFRNDLMFLLDQHKCDNLDCCVVSFRNSVNHAKDCTLGPNCQMYICRKKLSRSKHLKFCNTKCPECLIYKRSNVDEKYMAKILEMDCAGKQPASVGGVFLIVVTMYYVNYGLADIKKENVETEMQHLSEPEDKIENQTNSSASEDDEAAGWELI